MSLVVAGRIVPLTRKTSIAPKEDSSFDGKVWIDDDGVIAAVTKGTKKGPSGFASSPLVDVGSNLVIPGLIDLHSHLAYATLPLWVEPGRTEPFAHHDIWPTRPTYAESVTWPAYAFIEAAPAELLAYAEIRALIGGTTSIQGSPPSNKPLDGWLVRNVEDETLGQTVSADRVLASTLTMKPDQLGDRAEKMRNGATFIYHCAEGQPGSTVSREFRIAGTAGCLQDRLVAIHTNALESAEYGDWDEPGTIVWSPFSNLWLYGSTTDVPAAKMRGLRVCIGSDWGPSGTRNVLGELKVADLVNKSEKQGEKRNWGLSAFDLVKMVTANPGDVLAAAWDGRQTGRLQPDALGDLVVIAAPAGAGAFDRIVRATEEDVLLVVVGGRPLYGTARLMKKARAAKTSTLAVNGESRRIALTRFDGDRAGEAWSFAAVMKRLKEVRADPKRAIEQARRQAFRAIREEDEKKQPLRLALDMPTGIGSVAGLPKNLDDIVVPPIQPLAHDAAFFKSIKGRGFHGGLLDKLADFY